MHTLQASGWTKISKAGKASAPAPEVPDTRAAPSSGDSTDDKDLAAAIEVRSVHGLPRLADTHGGGWGLMQGVCMYSNNPEAL